MSSGWFEASAQDALIIPGYAYDGHNVRRAPGEIDFRLDGDANTGTVVAKVRDVIDTFEIRFANFSGRFPYQSGGVAKGIHLWGDTGNGSTVFPKVYVYAAAFGHAELFVNGQHQRDPTNLADTFPAYAFVTQGVYRDDDTYIVYGAEPARPYDPTKPTESSINRIGSQAVVLLYTSRGALYQHLEFRDVDIDRLG